MVKTTGSALRRDQVLAFIIDEIARVGISPSFEEIGRVIGVSKTRATQLISELVERGLIERTPASQRNLRVCDVRICRVVIQARLHALGWITADPTKERALPILPPFDLLPSPDDGVVLSAAPPAIESTCQAMPHDAGGR